MTMVTSLFLVGSMKKNYLLLNKVEHEEIEIKEFPSGEEEQQQEEEEDNEDVEDMETSFVNSLVSPFFLYWEVVK